MRPQRVPWQLKFAALSLIWGSSFLFIKVGLGSFDPIQVGAGRVLFGALTLGLTAAVLRVRLPRQGWVWAHLQIVGLLLATFPFLLFPLGETRVSSALAGIGNAITPIATVVATLALVPHERLPTSKLVAMVAGFVGVAVIMAPWEAGRPDLVGFGITLLGGACYGLGWTWVKRFLSSVDLGGLALPTAVTLTAAGQFAVVILAWWLPRRDVVAAPWSPVAALDGPTGGGSLGVAVAAVAALGVLGTGLAYSLQFDVYRAVGQQIGATVTYAIPVVAVLLGVLVLHERLGWAQLAGFAIVLGSGIAIGRPAPRPD